MCGRYGYNERIERAGDVDREGVMLCCGWGCEEGKDVAGAA